MQRQDLNYRIFIKPEKVGNEMVYVADCPTLDIKIYGNSIDRVLKRINYRIKLAVEGLVKQNKEIIGDNIYNQILANIQIEIPFNIKTISS